MDFIRAGMKENKDGTREFYPSLQALPSEDLVIRGGQFMAVWNESTGMYSRRLSHLPAIIDRSFAKMIADRVGPDDIVKKVRVYDNGIYSRLMGLIRTIGDMGPELDQQIVFADQEPTKEMACTFKMPYSMSQAPCPAWEEIISTLYDPDERVKIEYAIGSIFAGASVNEVQKFYVFFGPPGHGKGTILELIERLFAGHVAKFSAAAMGSSQNQFPLEPFVKNPLVAVDSDGDLSRLEINVNLNTMVAHEKLNINSKGKNLFEIKPRSTLFVGSNDPVKITNRKSGLFRRLVDIQPSGRLLDEERYHHLMRQVTYELGAIAYHCLTVFNQLGPTYLSSYRSTDMMYRTNDVFNFVQDNRMILEKGLTLKQAHKMYVDWCAETDTRNVYKQYQFRDILADYFDHFHDQHMVDGVRYRSYYEGLKVLETFGGAVVGPVQRLNWLDKEQLKEQASFLDTELHDMPAQYASSKGTPTTAWDNVETKLSDLDTSKEHYVKTPPQIIVFDFDLKDENGHKSLERNLAAAADCVPTHVEVSRGGGGLHLHYLYDGDVGRLASRSEDGSYEIKTLRGGASLRRKLSLCNDLPIATISSGIPIKEEKVISSTVMSGEKSLRDLILRALNKEINGGYTKPSMDFIAKALDDAHKQGMIFDVSDLGPDIMAFAMGSSNQRDKALEIAVGLKLASEATFEEAVVDSDKPVAYFDCEVYPDFFSIGWIYEDAPDEAYVEMVNPTPAEVQWLFDNLRLVGFFNRPYDNHILWARTLGYDNQALYELSQRIITKRDRRAMFGAAYNASYADVFDYLSIKQTLKKWQIELGLPHMEMDIPWDEPVPKDRIPDVLRYMRNDVLATREVARHRVGDFQARQILAELSGLEVINTNRQHTERMIFGTVDDTSADLVYTDLHEMFPGYKFDRFSPAKEKSTYKGEKVGEGGLVREKPGFYRDVALLDVASMHPTSIVELNLFGPHTKKFKDLLDVRLAIKAKELDRAAGYFDGRLRPYLNDESTVQVLSDALKIVINSVYGLTAASFPNKFKDEQNIDNIVAKRGALFMMDLMEFVEKRGFTVVHIKTDSVKIPGATIELIDEIFEFGKKYGYTFEHEATYDRFCLVNAAVYVAHDPDKGWSAKGAQFKHPVVFKTLFTKEMLEPSDYVEVKQVSKGVMYLESPDSGERQFVGRFGAFVPVLNGRRLLRVDGDKEGAVTGTKDYLWELDERVYGSEYEIDMNYFQGLIGEAIRDLEQFVPIAELTA